MVSGWYKMKNIPGTVGRVLLIMLAVAALYAGNLFLKPVSTIKASLAQLSPAAPLNVGGEIFRDLNRNGVLDPYEDYRIATELRVENLLGQMTLAEKAGQMFHPPVLIEPDPLFQVFMESMNGGISVEERITHGFISHFNFYGSARPQAIAHRLNELQRVAEATRLGIPLSISSDPVHEVPRGGGIASFSLAGLSKWPSQLGFAAARSPSLLEEFGRIAALEYRAMGFTTALHPMSDMATEPRWSRNFGTFGSNAALSSVMTAAYIAGFQGDTLTDQSVMTMVKHFPGGGPQEDGWDPHLKSGENQVYPGDNFDYHLAPFITAIEQGMRVVMPYYGIPVGQTDEDVAMAYNRAILTDLLRGELGFTGVVCSDWSVITDRNWGVEGLSVSERYQKSIEAGIDQYGGEHQPEIIIGLVNAGHISENRINESVRRILRNKFDLGLFEQPFVNEAKITERVNQPLFQERGLAAQRQSIVLLANEVGVLPLKENTRVFVDGLDPTIAAHYAHIVDDPDKANVIILFLNTVFNGNQPPGTERILDSMVATLIPDEDLAFNADIVDKAEGYAGEARLITVVDLNRPAILTELVSVSDALVGTFGVSDEAILDVVFGRHSPNGKLPFELPSSMSEVRTQLEDIPDDTANPLFPYGWGLSFGSDEKTSDRN